MGGFVRAGAHMLVNLQAGNCTGISAQTHALPAIYTQFVTEATLPPRTSLDPALLLTLSSALLKSDFIFVTQPKHAAPS